MRNFTFTREQEIALIEIGMNTLFRSLPLMMNGSKPATRKKVETKEPKKKKRTMSVAARKAISRRMKAIWRDKRAGIR